MLCGYGTQDMITHIGHNSVHCFDVGRDKIQNCTIGMGITVLLHKRQEPCKSLRKI